MGLKQEVAGSQREKPVVHGITMHLGENSSSGQQLAELGLHQSIPHLSPSQSEGEHIGIIRLYIINKAVVAIASTQEQLRVAASQHCAFG